MKTQKTLLLLTMLIYGCQCFSQPLYTQSNREVEYHYGIIAEEDLPKISEIEKIKHEFRYQQRTINKTIDGNYRTVMDITIDSNGYEQSWMTPARRFRYDEKGISSFDKQNRLISTLSYTDNQRVDNTALISQIKDSGFHPGIPSFPVFNREITDALQAGGIRVELNEDQSTASLVFPDGVKEVYDVQNLTITKTWNDKEGQKNIETDGYEPYTENRGYLKRIRKHETFLQSVNGPCIIDVKLVYYSDYNIKDGLGLIDKATREIENIKVYPNPNDGVFSVSVELPQDRSVLATRITNLLTGEAFGVNRNNDKTFAVTMKEKASGHYVIQVITDKSSLSAHFFKQ